MKFEDFINEIHKEVEKFPELRILTKGKFTIVIQTLQGGSEFQILQIPTRKENSDINEHYLAECKNIIKNRRGTRVIPKN